MTCAQRSKERNARSRPAGTKYCSKGAGCRSRPAVVTRRTSLSVLSVVAMFQLRIPGPAILAPMGSLVTTRTRVIVRPPSPLKRSRRPPGGWLDEVAHHVDRSPAVPRVVAPRGSADDPRDPGDPQPRQGAAPGLVVQRRARTRQALCRNPRAQALQAVDQRSGSRHHARGPWLSFFSELRPSIAHPGATRADLVAAVLAVVDQWLGDQSQ